MIRITIDDNKEVEIKTTKGLEETALAANAAIEILRQCKPTEMPKRKLVLSWVSTKDKLKAVKAVKEVMNFDLEKAKDCVNSSMRGDDVILASGSKEEMTNTYVKFQAYHDIMNVHVLNS